MAPSSMFIIGDRAGFWWESEDWLEVSIGGRTMQPGFLSRRHGKKSNTRSWTGMWNPCERSRLYEEPEKWRAVGIEPTKASKGGTEAVSAPSSWTKAIRRKKEVKMKEPERKTLDELKIFIAGRFDNVEKDIHSIKKDLKKIKEEIHALGNGKPGIAYRVDRLEKLKNWALWIIGALATALVAGLIAHYFSLIEKLIGK